MEDVKEHWLETREQLYTLDLEWDEESGMAHEMTKILQRLTKLIEDDAMRNQLLTLIDDDEIM